MHSAAVHQLFANNTIPLKPAKLQMQLMLGVKEAPKPHHISRKQQASQSLGRDVNRPQKVNKCRGVNHLSLERDNLNEHSRVQMEPLSSAFAQFP